MSKRKQRRRHNQSKEKLSSQKKDKSSTDNEKSLYRKTIEMVKTYGVVTYMIKEIMDKLLD